MHMLSDDALLEAYRKAVSLNLEPEFIQLLRKEISFRGLDKHLYREQDHIMDRIAL